MTQEIDKPEDEPTGQEPTEGGDGGDAPVDDGCGK